MEKVTGQRLFFGPFELRTDSGELFRDGAPVSIQPQPARLLELLARRSGEVVTREEIQRHLWGEDTFVEFEQGLNFSIRKLRLALGDSAGEPRYLETIPRRGYRFLVPVTNGTGSAPASEPPWPASSKWRRRWAAALLALMLVLLASSPGTHLTGDDPGSRLSRQAYQAYTEGRFLARKAGTRKERERAWGLLQEAIFLAPDFAPAYSVYAQARLDFSWPPGDSVRLAEAAARKALALDPNLLAARLVLADIELYFRFNPERARREIDRALDLAPDSPGPHRRHAAYLASQGRLGDALAAARRALVLDPESSITVADLAFYSFLARRYDDALALARRTLELAPGDMFAQCLLVDIALAGGDPELALAQANATLRAVPPREGLPGPPAHVDHLQGYWQWVIQRKIAETRLRPISPEDLALPFLYLGDREKALRHLEKASREKFGWELAFLAVDPRFDPLRGEPRFQRVLQALGLAPS